MIRSKKMLAAALFCILALAPGQRAFSADQVNPDDPVDQVDQVDKGGPSGSQPESSAPQETTEQLQQLVAPIALYPDALVAQILAASTYPVQIVEAERWLQQNSNLKGTQLATEVDKQYWDPSVKALTQFPAVLANLDKNLSWTSALGDAYFNRQQEVLDAVQVMRKRAETAGSLQSTAQQTVTVQGATTVIEPAIPEVVYVPVYDPWVVYGPPVPMYPGYIYEERIGPPGIFFGLGIGVGMGFSRFGWGWHRWGFDWRDRAILYNRRSYISRSHTFVHGGPPRLHGEPLRPRGDIPGRSLRGAGLRPGPALPRPGGAGDRRIDRGFGPPRGQTGVRSGAFSGFEHGGTARSFSSRGRSSVGGSLRGAPNGAARRGAAEPSGRK